MWRGYVMQKLYAYSSSKFCTHVREKLLTFSSHTERYDIKIVESMTTTTVKMKIYDKLDM